MNNATDSTPALRAVGLTKSFPNAPRVLDGLDLVVPRGRVLGLVGRNGSGKTTLLRCAMGLLRSDAGEVSVLGRRFVDAPPAHKARVAYVSQQCAAPINHDMRAIARVNALLYPNWDDALLKRLVTRFELPAAKPLKDLSVGQRQMAVVALAFASRPEVILLDEPAAGLDPVSCRHLITTVAESVSELEGATMIMSTHRLQDIERVADSLAVLRAGKIVSHESLDTLRTQVRRIQVVFSGGTVPTGFTVPGTLRTRTEGSVVNALIRLDDEAPLNALRTMPGLVVVDHPVSLEDLFVEHFAHTRA